MPYKIKQKTANGVVSMDIDAKTVDGHAVEETGIASNTTTIPTTAQVKAYVDANVGSGGDIEVMSQQEFDNATSGTTPSGDSPFLDLMYPIGSIYISSNSTSPASRFGGTWTRIKDRFILAVGDTYTTTGATGGNASHTHHLSPDKVVAQICVDGSNPAGLRANASVPNVTSWQSGFKIGGSSFTSETTNRTYGTGVEGNTDNSNNMPPYITKYIWERIA